MIIDGNMSAESTDGTHVDVVVNDESKIINTERPVTGPLSPAHFQLVKLSKLCFFLLYCARGALEPYISVFLSQRGYAVSQASTVMSVLTVVMAAATPFLSYVADKYRSHEKMHFYCLVLSLIVAPLIAFTAEDAPNDRAPVNNEKPSLFLPLFFTIIFGLVRAPVQPLLDSAALTAVSIVHDESLYGRLRVYGSIGFMIGGFVAGFLTDAISSLAPFGWYSLFIGVSAIATRTLYIHLGSSRTDLDNQYQKVSSSPSMVRPNSSMFKDVHRIMYENWQFFLVVVLSGMSHAICNVIVPLFLRKTLQAPGLIVGLSLVFACGSEIPLFMYGKQVTNMVSGGKLSSIALSFLCGIVRMMLYSLSAYLGDLGAPNFGMMFTCIGSALHGFTFSMFWSSCVAICNSLAPPHLKATFQGILSALFNGCAASLGSFIGGFIFDEYSPNSLFEVFALVNFCALTLFILSNRKQQNEDREQS